GARLRALGADGLFVYVRHGGNTWRFGIGEAEGFVAHPEPELPSPDRAFYAARCRTAPSRPPTDGSPLVSCIMPTLKRRRFVPRAIEYFLRQDHPAKELVILDDGSDPVADLIPEHPAIVYRRLEHRLVLGAKRNMACEMARGEIIAHWDDDDW